MAKCPEFWVRVPASALDVRLGTSSSLSVSVSPLKMRVIILTSSPRMEFPFGLTELF